jgi:hypothetical protein
MEELSDYIGRSRRQIDETRARQGAEPAFAGH